MAAALGSWDLLLHERDNRKSLLTSAKILQPVSFVLFKAVGSYCFQLRSATHTEWSMTVSTLHRRYATPQVAVGLYVDAMPMCAPSQKSCVVLSNVSFIDSGSTSCASQTTLGLLVERLMSQAVIPDHPAVGPCGFLQLQLSSKDSSNLPLEEEERAENQKRSL